MEMILLYLHLLTIAPAALIGALLLAGRKGDRRHKRLGRLYMALMLATAAVTVFMPASFEPRLFSHFGLLHLLPLLVFFTVRQALRAARAGDIAAHRRAMVALYIGGIVAAGGAALLLPGRFLHRALF